MGWGFGFSTPIIITHPTFYRITSYYQQLFHPCSPYHITSYSILSYPHLIRYYPISPKPKITALLSPLTSLTHIFSPILAKSPHNGQANALSLDIHPHPSTTYLAPNITPDFFENPEKAYLYWVSALLHHKIVGIFSPYYHLYTILSNLIL